MPNINEQFLQACRYEPTEALNLLLTLPIIDVNSTDSDGKTPLHYAILKMHIGLINKLLEAGVNLNAQDSYGNTPLHEAVKVNNQNLANMLLLAGASLKLKNWQEYTPIDLAISLDNQALANSIQIYYQYLKGQVRQAFAKIKQLEHIVARQQSLLRHQGFVIQQQQLALISATSPAQPFLPSTPQLSSASKKSRVKKKKTSHLSTFFNSDEPRPVSCTPAIVSDEASASSSSISKIALRASAEFPY